MPVDDEPVPFWDGSDEDARLEAWKTAVSFDPAWGSVGRVARLNGSSGLWVVKHVLEPLRAGWSETWVTDCLDTYHASTGASARVADTYRPFAEAFRLRPAVLKGHPNETAVVREALANHRARLLSELRSAKPELVVTLGNAALRVVHELLGVPLTKLAADGYYGKECMGTLDGHAVRCLPLAHPAAPEKYQEAHAHWREARMAPRA